MNSSLFSINQLRNTNTDNFLNFPIDFSFEKKSHFQNVFLHQKKKYQKLLCERTKGNETLKKNCLKKKNLILNP
ncbi:hypothetical protein M0811_09637 [Anaeramoeba ignava]|uniref:Uncharacterized protein n=1 Tax=Anaeramoeba ignava TaxID=1746090 RepID=A0A9Q0LIC8_ANAIG|nr:hypothetical protein M0811_09637 [Anaeramoeba ignava]